MERWDESEDNLCILHAKTNNKPISAIKAALDELADNEVITGACLSGIEDGSRLSFSDKKLVRTDFTGSSFRGVDFSGGNFTGSDFSQTDLSHTDFTENATLSQALFVDSNCNSTTFTTSDLTSVRFDDSNLVGAQLQHTDAPGANFESAKLVDVMLFNSELNDSVFRSALLENVRFNRSRLDDANFTDAEIFDCEFVDSHLSTARFNGAYIDDATNFGNRLLLEYDADRKADPTCLLELFDIKRLDRDFFGNPNTGTPPGDPPTSAIDKQYDSWKFQVKLRILAFTRLFTRISSPDKDTSNSTYRNSPWLDLETEDEMLIQAENVYGSLKSAFRDSARPDRARHFNIREKEARRKRSYLGFEWPKLALLKWWMRYGESPQWVIGVGACLFSLSLVGFLCTGIELSSGAVVSLDPAGRFQFEYLLRVMLFTGRRLFTFSNGEPELLGFGNQLATLVSIIGKLVEAALIFTFGRRAVA